MPVSTAGLLGAWSGIETQTSELPRPCLFARQKSPAFGGLLRRLAVDSRALPEVYWIYSRAGLNESPNNVTEG